MIPLRDENPTTTTPIVTIGLIAVNVLVYVYQLTLPIGVEAKWINAFGAVPSLLVNDFVRLPLWPEHWPTLISAMFLHGGILHLASNMLYLWIFGNNIEDHLGHVRFILFYLAAGLSASLAHVFSNIASPIPMIGASGAISGVLGAYFVLYPRARVVVMIWLFFFIRFIHVPAFLVLGLWFIMQIPGALDQSGGIAWFAHIGGFIFGFLVIRVFHTRRPRRPFLP